MLQNPFFKPIACRKSLFDMKFKLHEKEKSEPLLRWWKETDIQPYKYSISEVPGLQHLLHGGYDIGQVTYFSSGNHFNGLIYGTRR
jgi:hypothetical protein